MRRHWFENLPIKRKLMLITTLISAVVLLISWLAFVSSETIRNLKLTRGHVEILSDVIGYNCRAPLAFDDRQAAAEILAALAAESQVLSAAVYDQNGNIFASYQSGKTNESIPPKPSEDGDYYDGDHLLWFKGIVFADKKVGTVFIHIDLASLYAALKTDSLIALLIMALSVTVAFVLSAKLQSVISKPILHLVDIIKRVSQDKDYTVRATPSGAGELGLLINGFNEMLNQINTRDIELEKHRSSLEEEVEARTAEVTAILDTAPDAIITCNGKGEITKFNHAAEEMLQIPEAEAIKGKITDFIKPPGMETAQLDADTLFKQLTKNTSSEVVGIRKTGETFPMELSFSDVTLGSQQLITILGRDISQRKTMEGRLLQAQKLESIGQLAAGIAHEINTPIQYISDNTCFLKAQFAELLQLIEGVNTFLNTDSADDVMEANMRELKRQADEADISFLVEEVPKALDQSLEGLQRVAEIVRSMREFSHPGKREKIALNINEAITSTLTVSRNEWKYVADVKTDLDPTLPLVPCYPGDFNQVILNIIVNAAQAIAEVIDTTKEEKGEIFIKTRGTHKAVEISISDTGGGIPTHLHSRIFDPFFTTKEVGKGTGQGLAIAHQVVVERHNGTIDVQSEIGKGSTFIITIPLV